MGVNDAWEWIGKIRGLWHKPTGLFLSLFLTFSILTTAALTVHPIARDDLKILEAPKDHYVYLGSFLLIAFVLTVLITFFWLKNRKLPKLPNGKPSIIFALNAGSPSNDPVKKVYEGFRKEILSRNLQSVIHYEVLPKNHEVHNHDQASEILGGCEATIVVFGEYQKGKSSSKNTEQFSSLSFHWRGAAPLNEREQALVAAMEQFPFRIDETDSLTQIPRARAGFANLTLFFVGISLTSMGNCIEARDLWRDLVKREKRLPRKGKRISLYQVWWARNEFAYTQYIYRKRIENRLTDVDAQEDGRKVIESLEIAKRQLSSNPGYYMLRAICEFHVGEVRAAQQTTRDGWKKFPCARVGFDLSEGFLYLWRGMHKMALKSYRKTAGASYQTEDAERIVRFIHTVIKMNPERVDLYFSVAFIRDYFSAGKPTSDYDHFIDSCCASVPGIEPLITYPQQRLDYHYRELKEEIATSPDTQHRIESLEEIEEA